MKIATWNIHGGAALPWYDNKVIKSEAVDRVMEVDADIFVITEFALASGWDYLEEKMKENGYVWFSSFVSGSNGILMLVKKNLIKDVNIMAKNLWWGKEALYSDNDIGLMRVSFVMKNEKTCTVCGFRMPVDNSKKEGREKYNEMGKILDEKILPIAKECYSKNDVVIFAGDFNNARYLEDYSGKDQFEYNWQILKKKFEGIGYRIIDIDDAERPIVIRNNPPSPIDHFFVKGFKKDKCDTIYSEYSDHYILIAEIKQPVPKIEV